MAKSQSIYRFVVIASFVALLFCEVDAAKRRGGRKNGELAIWSKRLFPPWRCQVSLFWIQAFSIGLLLSIGTSRSHKFRNAGYLFLALFVFIFAPVLFTFVNALRKDPAVPQVYDAFWLIFIVCSKSVFPLCAQDLTRVYFYLQLARATYEEVRRRGFSFLDVGDAPPTPQQVNIDAPSNQDLDRRVRRPAEKAA